MKLRTKTIMWPRLFILLCMSLGVWGERSSLLSPSVVTSNDMGPEMDKREELYDTFASLFASDPELATTLSIADALRRSQTIDLSCIRPKRSYVTNWKLRTTKRSNINLDDFDSDDLHYNKNNVVGSWKRGDLWKLRGGKK